MILLIVFWSLVVVGFLVILKIWWPIAPTPLDEEGLSSKIKFPVGTKIKCPKCGEIIATSNRNIYYFEKAVSSAWDGLDPKNGFRCPKDRVCYARWNGNYGELHTTNGWVGSPQ